MDKGKELSIAKLKARIKDLENENDKLTSERNSYRDFGAEAFKVCSAPGTNSTLNSLWVMNRLAVIYNGYGMPFIQWKKNE